MSAEDRVTLPASGSAGGVALPDDEDALRAALAAEREARAAAEARAAEWDVHVARLETDLRTLATLRDNFHNLYREERELRAAAELSADGFTEERDRLETELATLRSEIERLQRAGARPAPAPAAPPVEPPPAAAPQGHADRHLTELEHELGILRARAADLEAALLDRETALVERDAALAEARERRHDAPGADNAELVAATRRIHDLDGELAVLRKEHSDLRAAHDRIAGMRQRLEEQLSAEQALRAEAQRVATEAGQRSADAASSEKAAVAEAGTLREAAERTDLALQAAKASIGVLEQRLREAEETRAAAERRLHELEGELSYVRSDVLTGRAAQTRRPLLRRRGNHADAQPHLETTGTPVEHATPVEVAAAAEDVEQALHRRLFSDD